MFMHNGAITGFRLVRRALTLPTAPSLFAHLEGTTASEVRFYPTFTYGLGRYPPATVARMAGEVERPGREHGVDFPLQMALAITDGEHL